MLAYPYNHNIKKDINDDFGYGFYVDLEESNTSFHNTVSISKYKGQKFIHLPTISGETNSISIVKETNINQNYIERILIIIFIFINIKLFFL